MHQKLFVGLARPGPTRGADSAPRLLSWIRGGDPGTGKGRKGRELMGRKGRGRRRESCRERWEGKVEGPILALLFSHFQP